MDNTYCRDLNIWEIGQVNNLACASRPHLECNGEIAEALSEDPDNRVAEPDDDRNAGELAVYCPALTASGLSRLGPRLAEREDNVQKPGHSKEPPDPLDISDRESAKSTACDHQNWQSVKKCETTKLAQKKRKANMYHPKINSYRQTEQGQEYPTCSLRRPRQDRSESMG